MSEKLRSTHTQPGGLIEEKDIVDEEMVNDSLGTIDISDSTGSEEEKENGDAKVKNKNTKED